MDRSPSQIEQASSQPFYRIWLCGSLRVERFGGTDYAPIPSTEWNGRRSPRLLLKALLCLPRRQAQRSTLSALLWPDMPPSKAELNLAISILRRVLRFPGQESLLIAEENALYRLGDQSLLWVDIDAALDLLDHAERAGTTTERALPFLQQAATYFERGPLLEEERGWLWVREHRQAWETAAYRCTFWLAEAHAQQGRVGQAQALLSTLLTKDPGDEDVLRRLMELFHQQSLTHQALKLFEASQLQLQQMERSFSPAMMAYRDSLR